MSEPSPSADTARGRGEPVRPQLSRLQQSVARRMAESKAIAPDATFAVDVDMTAALEHAAAAPVDGDPPSVGELVVHAAGRTLRAHPAANAAYRDGGFERFPRVNVGVTVFAREALLVPTVFDADTRSLAEVAAVMRALVARVRDGSIEAPEQTAGTFTVTDLSAHGADRFEAVLVPPQAAALAVGALRQAPMARDGAVVVAPVVTLTLTCDQRILRGPDAAAFLAGLRERLKAGPGT